MFVIAPRSTGPLCAGVGFFALLVVNGIQSQSHRIKYDEILDENGRETDTKSKDNVHTNDAKRCKIDNEAFDMKRNRVVPHD